MEYIGVLRQIYSRSSYPPQITGNTTNSFILDYALNTINNCDFSVIPESILLIKLILERDPSSITKMNKRRKGNNLQNVLDWIQNLMETEFQGEMHFWTTIIDTISFICSTFKLNLGIFNLNDVLPWILKNLPVKGDDMEAENIYSTLILFVSNPQNNDLISEFGNEFLRVFVQTLGLKDETLRAFLLSEMTLVGMKNFIKSCLANGITQDVILEMLQMSQGDPNLFSSRLSI